jgi:hypothetical protein
MRLRHPSGRLIFLSCGLNLQPVAGLPELTARLDAYADVRERLGVDTLAITPWLPPGVAARLAVEGRARRRLRADLDARRLEVVTLSGVPYEAPSDAAGKRSRYRPDWTSMERLEYTLDLARVLVDLLPDDVDRGSVSTLPLAWGEPWDEGRQAACRRVLDRLSGGLAEIAWHTGRAVRVGFQPEPGCVIGSTVAAITALARTSTERVGVCLDTASLACGWEEPSQALGLLATAGLPVVKVQLTAALEAADPVAAAAALRGYVEPGRLHQTRAVSGAEADDLDEALGTLPPVPWRVRYHVPLNRPPAPPLAATTPVWRAALRALLAGDLPGCDHLDVETESWDSLPPGDRPADLLGAVAEELAYARTELIALGLAPAVCAH